MAKKRRRFTRSHCNMFRRNSFSASPDSARGPIKILFMINISFPSSPLLPGACVDANNLFFVCRLPGRFHDFYILSNIGRSENVTLDRRFIVLFASLTCILPPSLPSFQMHIEALSLGNSIKNIFMIFLRFSRVFNPFRCCPSPALYVAGSEFWQLRSESRTSCSDNCNKQISLLICRCWSVAQLSIVQLEEMSKSNNERPSPRHLIHFTWTLWRNLHENCLRVSFSPCRGFFPSPPPSLSSQKTATRQTAHPKVPSASAWWFSGATNNFRKSTALNGSGGSCRPCYFWDIK